MIVTHIYARRGNSCTAGLQEFASKRHDARLHWAVLAAQSSRKFAELDRAVGGGRAVNMQAELARRGLLR